jgi:hypothetical protein
MLRFLLQKRLFSSRPIQLTEKFKVTFITPQNEKISVKVRENTNLLDAAHANDIDLEGSLILKRCM